MDLQVTSSHNLSLNRNRVSCIAQLCLSALFLQRIACDIVFSPVDVSVVTESMFQRTNRGNVHIALLL